MSRQIEFLEQPSANEKTRREATFTVGREVRVTTTYYGPDLFGRPGTLVGIDRCSLYPYSVAVEGVPGFDRPVVRTFDWYEIDS